MNTDLMFSSKTDMWATPQWFFDELDKEFHFIKGVNGEFYPCKPDIFEKTYERVEEE